MTQHLFFFSKGHIPTTRSEVRPSCSSTPAILSAVIAVIITALLATVIFVVVQIVICKCHPKFRLGETETGASAGGEGPEYEVMGGGVTKTGISAGGEEQEYEQIDRDEGSVTEAGITARRERQEYEMVVGGYEGGVAMSEQREQSDNQTFELQQNEAYGTYSSS